MRTVWGLIIITSSVCALSTLRNAEELTKSLSGTNNTDDSLNSQCSNFVQNCLESCAKDKIENFSSACTSRNATCTCNDVDISEKIFNVMLQGLPGAITTDKKKLQVENSASKNQLRPVQFNAVLGETDQNTVNANAEGEDSEDEEEGEMYGSLEDSLSPKELQQMEYIHPNPAMARSELFQEKYCTHFMIRCKQDCPASFSSYSCDPNADQNGFLLTCICNAVDIAASVNAQVQAEM